MLTNLSALSFRLLAAALLVAAPGWSRRDASWCGVQPGREDASLALHRHAAELRAKSGIARFSGTRSANRDLGNVAVIEGTGGVVSAPNQFNLDSRTVRFLPTGAGYRFETTGDSFRGDDATQGSTLTLLGDDDTRMVPLPFSFNFYGRTFASVFVNSDGNLTFDRPDTATSDRSLGRVTAGPPRIAPFFEDLDPSNSGSVRVFSSAERFAVTWVSVPEYRGVGTGPLNTFQVTLYPTGRIEIALQSLSTRTAVVGISPGAGGAPSSVVSFQNGSSQEFAGAVVERFTSASDIDTVLTAQRFYETHDDAYDYLVIFNTRGISAGSGAIAFEETVRNERRGIGDRIADNGPEYGSARRLQAVLNMGPLTQYPRDPSLPIPARPSSGDTSLTVLAHEAGHLFLAFASVRDANGNLPMLGFQSAHWSSLFNSDASLMDGVRVRDNGAGASPRFITTGAVERYSDLDQYLMGFREPALVPPAFYVANASIAPRTIPQTGVVFNGVRRDVTVDEVIAAEGPRIPDHTVAQRHFRFAFILIPPENSEPTAAQLAQLEEFRVRFESFFADSASGRASAETRLQRDLRLSLAPAGGILSGGPREAALLLDRPAEDAFTVDLTSSSPSVTVPARVEVPAGATRATFQVTGAGAGTADIRAMPSTEAYSTSVARVQVLDSATTLRPMILSGDRQTLIGSLPLPLPVVVRVADANQVAYAGQRITATAQGGGQVEPASATSGADGTVSFRWTPGAGPLHEIQFAVGSNTAAAVALGGVPFATAESVVNAASFQPGIPRGGLATLFGLNLSNGVTRGPVLPQSELERVRVEIAGRRMGLFFVSDRQVNFVVPSDLPEGPQDMIVSYGDGPGQASTPVRVNVKAADPGIFFDASSGIGAILIAGTGLTTIDRPAVGGDILEVYVTGVGTAPPTVTIGGQPADVLFSGAAPGFFGLGQVNVRVPAGLAAGRQPVQITAASARSNSVPINVR